MSKPNRVAAEVTALVLLFGMNAGVRAATKQWVATVGNWTASANWSPSGMPQDFDNVLIRTFDATHRVATYNVGDGFLHYYGDVTVQSPGTGGVEFKAGFHDLDLSSLTVGGSTAGDSLADFPGGQTFVQNLTLGTRGLLQVGGGLGRFNVTNFTQDAGTLTISPNALLTVSGTYRFNGAGKVTGPVRNDGTIIFDTPTSHTPFGGRLDNRGTMVLNRYVDFLDDVVNRASNTLPQLGDLQISKEFAHRGGTFSQVGNINILGGSSAGQLRVGGGGTWNQSSGYSDLDQLSIGSGSALEPLAGAGTYLLSGDGQLRVRNPLIVGAQSDGTFVQNGGSVQVGFDSFGTVVVGSGTGRGYYKLVAGSLGSPNTVIGGADAAGGTLVQTGGTSFLGDVVMNFNSTSSGQLLVSGGTVAFRGMINNGTFTLSGGSAATSPYQNPGAIPGANHKIDGSGTLSVTGTGLLSVARIRQNALNISGNGRITTFLPDIPLALPTNRVQSLTIEQAGNVVRGTWDLGPSSLVIDYGGSTPAASIRRYLASGYNGGAWHGTGLNSSAAAVANPRNKALGYAEASEIFGAAGGVFEDVLVDSSSVLVKYTYYGDTDLNGIVNFDDYARVDNGFNNHNGNTWFRGDFDYNGVVNFDDYALIDLAFNTQSGTLRPDSTLIPEPSIGATIALAMLLSRRRVKSSRLPPA